MLLHDALRELNVAAYGAMKAARGSDLAERLQIMALDTDAMVDGRPLIDIRTEYNNLQAESREAAMQHLADLAQAQDRCAELAAALVGLIPGHRDPDGQCWCEYSRNPDYGHSVACRRARAVFSVGDAS